MEWNDERTKLHSLSLGLLSHRRNLMSKFGTACRHASISKHCTVASSSSGALIL